MIALIEVFVLFPIVNIAIAPILNCVNLFKFDNGWKFECAKIIMFTVYNWMYTLTYHRHLILRICNEWL